MTNHYLKINSQLGQDIVSLDVPFEQLRAWLSYGKCVTKKDVIEIVRRIRGVADHIEYTLKRAGYEYMDATIMEAKE